MSLRRLLSSLLLTCVTLTAAPAAAAEIEVLNDHPEGCNAMLTGQISAGDTGTLRQRLIGDGDDIRYFHDVVTLCLDSPGGSFLEGLALARQLRQAGIATHVPAGARCLSACALAFMGGSRLGVEVGITHSFNRSLHATAQLGFHAPQLDIPPGRFNETEVKRAFALALKSSALIFARLEELGLSQDFALAFFDVPEGSFLMVDTPDRADAAQVTVTGTGPLPRRLSPERVADLCGRAFPRFSRGRDNSPDIYAEVVRTEVMDLPPQRAGVQRTAFLQAVSAEGLISWDVCELRWQPQPETFFDQDILLTHHGIYDFHPEEWENPPPLTRADLLPRLDQQIEASATLMPVLAFPDDTPLAGLGRAAQSLARPVQGVASCAPVASAYSVHMVRNFSNLRAAPGLDAAIVQEVRLHDRVTPVARNFSATVFRSEACRTTCTPASRQALTPEDVSALLACAASNDVWWQVRTSDGTTGWMSSRFLTPAPG